MASRRDRAAAWLDGFAAGWRGHRPLVPAGFDVRQWLAGWTDGRELRVSMRRPWREVA
jgi:hypothetical protein